MRGADCAHNSKMETGKLPRRVIYCCAVILLLLAVAGWRRAGHWLVREDPLARADAVVVLSGGMPFRAEAAAKLVQMGYAPEIWVSRPAGAQAELAALGIHFVGDEEYDREVLLHGRVPPDAIHIFPDVIVDTEQEVEEIAREMQRTGKTKVIIVTSPPHTRRVRALWAELVPKDRTAIVRAAYEDPFDADHWWRNTRDALSVTREVLALMNAWAGLPIRPHSELAGAAPVLPGLSASGPVHSLDKQVLQRKLKPIQ